MTNWRLEGLDLAAGTRSYTTPLTLGRYGLPQSIAIENQTIWLGSAAGNGMTVTADAVYPAYTSLLAGGSMPALARFSTTGDLQYSSFLGGNYSGSVYALRPDGAGGVALCGSSSGTDWPITPDALEPSRTAFRQHKAIFGLYRSDGKMTYGTYINGLDGTSCDSLTFSQGTWVLSGQTEKLLNPGTTRTVQAEPSGNPTTWMLALSSAPPAPSNQPLFSAAGIVNAASFAGEAVAPGEVVTLFVQRAGPATLAGLSLTADRRVATVAGNTRVLFDGVAAPMIYALAGQISAIVPYGVSGKASTQVVVEYNGVASAPVAVPVAAAAPGLFTLAGGTGQVVAVVEGGCCNNASLPARPGEVIVLYATGTGQTNPAGRDGTLAEYATLAEYPSPILGVAVTVGGRPAEILYAGAAPGFVAGLLQLNIRLSRDTPVGDQVPVVLTMGNTSSRAGVTVVVR